MKALETQGLAIVSSIEFSVIHAAHAAAWHSG
jgi:hypothetical protein